MQLQKLWAHAIFCNTGIVEMKLCKLCILGASVSAANVVTLKKPDQVDLSVINKAQDCIVAAAEPETVSHLEEIVSHWCKQVAQVLPRCQGPFPLSDCDREIFL